MYIKYFDITSVSISDKVIPMFSFNRALSGQLWAAFHILKAWVGSSHPPGSARAAL